MRKKLFVLMLITMVSGTGVIGCNAVDETEDYSEDTYIYEDTITNSTMEVEETDYMPAEDIIIEDNIEEVEMHEFVPAEDNIGEVEESEYLSTEDIIPGENMEEVEEHEFVSSEN